MMRFFNKSKNCAKKRLLECIQSDRGHVYMNTEKIRREIEAVLIKYMDIDGVVTLDITVDSKNKRYIMAGACIK